LTVILPLEGHGEGETPIRFVWVFLRSFAK
jgi:hypothetical protein